MKNPKIVIQHIGKKFFDYLIFIPRENGDTEVIRGTTCQGRDIEIPVIKIDEAAFEKAMNAVNNSQDL